MAAILAAGGRGDRAQSGRAGAPKQFHLLGDRPVWRWAFDVLAEHCDDVVVVVPDRHLVDLERDGVSCVGGGDTRQASVANGLAVVDAEQVIVHDAARPFVTRDLVVSAIQALDDADGAVAALPLRDTIARVEDGAMSAAVDRDVHVRVQTPQAFWTQALVDSHRRAEADGILDATDDAQLATRCGYRIAVVPGDEDNIKITYAPDLAIAAALAEQPR